MVRTRDSERVRGAVSTAQLKLKCACPHTRQAQKCVIPACDPLGWGAGQWLPQVQGGRVADRALGKRAIGSARGPMVTMLVGTHRCMGHRLTNASHPRRDESPPCWREGGGRGRTMQSSLGKCLTESAARLEAGSSQEPWAAAGEFLAGKLVRTHG